MMEWFDIGAFAGGIVVAIGAFSIGYLIGKQRGQNDRPREKEDKP